jgi:hypothetical protein
LFFTNTFFSSFRDHGCLLLASNIMYVLQAAYTVMDSKLHGRSYSTPKLTYLGSHPNL